MASTTLLHEHDLFPWGRETKDTMEKKPLVGLPHVSVPRSLPLVGHYSPILLHIYAASRLLISRPFFFFGLASFAACAAVSSLLLYSAIIALRGSWFSIYLDCLSRHLRVHKVLIAPKTLVLRWRLLSL